MSRRASAPGESVDLRCLLSTRKTTTFTTRGRWERPPRSAGCGTCLVGSARRRDPHQSSDADQVVGGGDQIAGQSRPLQAEKARAAEATHRLHPAEDLLHAFADALADAIAGVPRGAPINGAAATTGVLGYVWRDVAFAHVLNKVLGVVVLVATQRRRAEAVLLGLVHLADGRLPLGGAGGGRHLEINHQPVPILHQRMPHEHQLGLLAPALAEQARVWVGGALVCRVRALLTMEVHA